MTYAHSGGDLMLVGRSAHRLQREEALTLLDAHRQAYRQALFMGDTDNASTEEALHRSLHKALKAQQDWNRAAGAVMERLS